jgi:hypothetical protein
MRRKPSKTPPVKRSIAKFSVEDFIAIMDKCSIDEPIRGRKLHWYHLIMENLLTCPATEKRVAYCSYDVMEHPNPKVQPAYHFNFYSEDDEMFTIDHKIPKSLGGTDLIDNVQPMIGDINWRKGSELIYT